MCQIFAGQNPRARIRHPPSAAERPIHQHPTRTRLLGHSDQIAAEEGISTPAFLSKLHSEVLQLHGEVSNFPSLLRCACTLRLGEMDLMGHASTRIAAE